jgi:hypothetical protein
MIAGVVAAAAAGTALMLLTYETNAVWYYAYVLFGMAVGVALDLRSQPSTWRVRSAFAVVFTLVSLSVSTYFIARAFAVDALRERGDLLPGETVPLFVPLTSMVRIVMDQFHGHALMYVTWAFSLFIAYAIPSARHATDKKRLRG